MVFGKSPRKVRGLIPRCTVTSQFKSSYRLDSLASAVSWQRKTISSHASVRQLARQTRAELADLEPHLITIYLNGELREVPESLTLAALLDWLKLPGDRVAVERNREIVPRSTWAETSSNPVTDWKWYTLWVAAWSIRRSACIHQTGTGSRRGRIFSCLRENQAPSSGACKTHESFLHIPRSHSR